MPHFEVKHFR